jgi:isocitrate dehydrogenase
MTRIIWKFIKDKLILPVPRHRPEVLRPRHRNRDETDDQVTIDSANAIKKYGVGVKCATITPDEARVKEFGLKKMWKSPNGTIRNILGGVDLPRADHLQERAAPGAGLDQADRHRPPRLRRPVPRHRLQGPRQGQADDDLHPEDGGKPIEHEVFDFPGGGVAMACTTSTIRSATSPAPLQLRPERGWPVYLSTKNTILKAYDGRFKDLFQEVFETEFKAEVRGRGITYEHRLIDDMVASALKWSAASSGPARTTTATCSPTRWRRASARSA